VTDHACREIRHGRLTREEALALVRYYEQRPVEYPELVYQWLGVTPRSMQFLTDQHRNSMYWHEATPGQWVFKGCRSREKSRAGVSLSGNSANCVFTVNAVIEDRQSPGYIVIGKGYP